MIILGDLTWLGKWFNGVSREWHRRDKQTHNEEPEMRRVRNQQINNGNPALMFAQGVESIVSDSLRKPGRYDEQEIREKQRVSNKQDSRGNLFNALFRQFANSW